MALADNKFHRTLYWICKEWKVLPTDPRFKDLTIEQINWLVYWAEHFNDPNNKDEPISPEVQSFLEDEVVSEPKKLPDFQKLEDITKIFEAGGDVTDWEDVTKEFIEDKGEFHTRLPNLDA